MILRTIFASVLLIAAAGCGDDASSKAPNGEACEVAEDCEADICWLALEGCHPIFGCGTFDLPGGMCAPECTWVTEGTVEERLQADCEEGEQCLAYADSPKICFQGCEVDEDCREDYECTQLTGFSTCLPPEDAARVVDNSVEVLADPTIQLVK